MRRSRVARARMRPITLAARSLEKARRDEADDETSRGHGPRLAAGKVFDVVQDPLSVGVLEVLADLVQALRGLFRELGRLLFSDPAELVGRGPNVPSRGGDLVSGLRRPLSELLRHAALGLPGGSLCLVA